MEHTRTKKCLLALISMVMVLALGVGAALPAFAENANIAPGTNLTTTFKKYLVMDENANVPDADFTFTITPGEAVAASGSRVIYAGDDSRVTGSPVLKVDGAGSSVSVITSFNPEDTTYTTQQDVDEVTLSENQKYAKKVVTVDFGSVKFNAPGIYRYVITETSSPQDGITPDSVTTRTLDVFVQYADAVAGGRLIVSNYILYQGTKTDAGNGTAETKDDGFTNTYTTKDLTLEKQVTGNQGDRDKYFAFTVHITGAVAGTVYNVDLANADPSPTVDGEAKTNAATLTATEGTVTAIYYLKDDQSIVIRGLTEDTKYTITEDPYTTDGYTTSHKIDGGEMVRKSSTDKQTMDNAAHKVIFTNDKEGIVPTGILLETAPYIILGLVVFAGLLALFATRRRRTNK